MCDFMASFQAPEKAGLPGFTVVRVGQDDKIDPLVKPISLDELAKKGLIGMLCLVFGVGYLPVLLRRGEKLGTTT